MSSSLSSLRNHRVHAPDDRSVQEGDVKFSPANGVWFGGMALAAILGGLATFSWAAFFVFLTATATVLLFGHSLGSHRKVIHNSFQCPKWLEYLLVYLGVQVGLAGPLGLMRQHELRDYAQRLPDCHPYLRHGSVWWRDAWWQLMCELRLHRMPPVEIEPSVANDPVYRWLEKTWRLQQLLPAILFYAWGGWAFVFWGVCARVTAGVGGHWVIGYFAHNHGQMNYCVEGAAVQGRNIRLTSLLTMGECWHNNHHAFPGSARLGLFAGEWDAGWWVLMVFRKIGLVWDIRLPQDLPLRPELKACESGAEGAFQPQAVPDVRVARVTARWMLKKRSTLQLTGPGALLSVRSARWLFGPDVVFLQDRREQRVNVCIDGARVEGLPACLLAMSTRPFLTRLAACCALPFANGFEAMRTALGMRHVRASRG